MFGFLIALIEIAIGISFLINKLDRIASFATVIYLFVSTLIILIIYGFDPRFPVLSIVGESVLKNLVLISACLVLLSEKNPTTTIERDLKQSKSP